MDRKRGFAIRRALMPSALKESTKKDSCVDSWTWPLAQDDGTSEHARHSVPAPMGAATPIPNSRAQPEHPAVLTPHVLSCQPSCHPRSSHSHALPHPPPPSAEGVARHAIATPHSSLAPRPPSLTFRRRPQSAAHMRRLHLRRELLISAASCSSQSAARMRRLHLRRELLISEGGPA
jgi:hypothetical protein